MSERTASCPNCGAEIVFRWSGAIQTTCPACRSILVRHDLDLEKVGVVSDVPASTSGIQLGTEGRFKEKSFVVVGRISYRYDLGHWNEWHIRFADETSGWLSDAQAEYAVSRATAAQVRIDPRALGGQVSIAGEKFTLVSVTRARYDGVEGELPFEYWDKEAVRFFDLRGPGGRFATVDETESPPLVFVGEYETFDELRFSNLREVDPGADALPAPKGLNCTSCGAAITLRTGALAHNVACPACGSIMDARDPNYAILQRHQRQTAGPAPVIPLGRTGMLKGKRWTAIGFQRRFITVDGTEYEWREYLLWNPEGGFRYLSEYDGHWNDITVIRGLPTEVKPGPQPEIEYLGTRFKHFQRAQAKTRFVIGEFPWQVRVGDTVTNDDYVAPPLMLSREQTADEITWSLGTYTSPALIKDAFKLEPSMRAPTGVFANQPNPAAPGGSGIGKLFLGFAAVLCALFVIRLATAQNSQPFSGSYRARSGTADTRAFVTPVFELKGHPSNVQVEIVTDLSNAFAFFNLALLPEIGGKGYEVGREISRYSGYEDGEYWSEGSTSDRVILPAVPPGRYYLRVEPELAQAATLHYNIFVKRDVPRAWPFLIAALLLSAAPVFALVRQSSFESARWAESDYAPAAAEDDDDE